MLHLLNSPIVNTSIGALIAVIVSLIGAHMNSMATKKRDRFSALKFMRESILTLLNETSTRLKAETIFEKYKHAWYTNEEAEFEVHLRAIDRKLRMPSEYFQSSFFTQYEIILRNSIYFIGAEHVFLRINKNIDLVCFYTYECETDNLHFITSLIELNNDLILLEKNIKRELEHYLEQ